MTARRVGQTRAWALLAALAAACSSRAPFGEAEALSSGETGGASDAGLTVEACSGAHCETDAIVLAVEARRFLTDVGVRREALVGSLLYTDNTYAAERLAAYAVSPGWEDLPTFDPAVARVALDDVGRLVAEDLGSWMERWGQRLAAGEDDWIAAGRDAFFAYPAQRFSELERVARVDTAPSTALLDALGVWRDEQRTLGAIAVRYADGSTGLAYTCATCHVQGDARGRRRVGAPSAIDVMALSEADSWGAGRVDVTADDIVNPVAIADLRATRVQRRLHHAGNLRNSLLGLAVRIDTLVITNNHAAVRPPREVAFALAAYIWSLGEDAARHAPGLTRASETEPTGSAVFKARCAACHQGEWGAGEWAPVTAVGTEPLVATSPARGTGGYRVPALLGFQERPLSHEARREGLEVWLAGDRDATLGAADGHAARAGGAPLSDEELSALVAYLRVAFPLAAD